MGKSVAAGSKRARRRTARLERKAAESNRRRAASIAILSGAVVVLLAGTTVVVGSAVVEFADWDGEEKGLAPIAIVASDHSPLDGAGFLVDDPSLDIWFARDPQGEVGMMGMFRFNPVSLSPNDGEARIGLLLPSRSQFVFGGPTAEGTMSSVLISSTEGGATGPFSCEPQSLPGTVDARELENAIWDGLSWTAECSDQVAAIWMQLPADQPKAAGMLADDSQQVATSTAGMIDFRLPNYGGAVRTSFDSWSATVEVESGRRLSSVSTQAPSALLPGLRPVVAFHDSEQFTLNSFLPASVNLKNRPYLDVEAHTWSLPLDGSVESFSAVVTDRGLASWRGLLAFAAPLVIGLVVGALLTWGARRVWPPKT